MDKIERLINLTAHLLDTSRPVTFDELSNTVYADQPRGTRSEKNALHKMFERDKEELRDMGVEIAVEKSALGGEEGYSIPHDRYYLPRLDLEPEEKVALTMVSRLFLGSGTPFSGPARSALLKLTFDGDAVEEVPRVHWVASRAGSQALSVILDAMNRRKTVTFAYRALDAAEPLEREVEPYGLFNRGGSWYLVGRCLFRGAARCFKLERVVSEVAVNPRRPRTPDFEIPEEFDLREEIPWEWPSGAPAGGFRARVEFSPRLSFARDTGPARIIAERVMEEGGHEVEYEAVDPEQLLDWVLGFGEDARIKAPDELREMARDRLVGLLEAMEGR
jgi:proteasome accessory factor B